MDIFSIFKSKDKKDGGITFVKPSSDDGAIDIDVGGFDHAAQILHSFDLDRIPTNEYELLSIYRNMSLHQEIDQAIQEICNDAIISDNGVSVEISLYDVDLSDNIKEKIIDEFNYILKLLKFKSKGYNIFTRWYIDGKIIYHKVIDKSGKGIVDLLPIDPLYIKLIREHIVQKNSSMFELELYDTTKSKEYFIYSKVPLNSKDMSGNEQLVKNGVKIPRDAIAYVTSGVTDETGKAVLSYLYKSIKPWNNLKLMEDSVVIYRVTRAPERRAFYIDVGNLPKGKAEQYLKDIMNRFKNKIVYDASTGTVNQQKKFQAMIEDYWLPRREGGRGTEIDLLQGGQQLGEIDDVNYFKDKLYRSLNVPLSRFQQDSSSFNLGRTSEITRDEVKFSKFINRLRVRFSQLFEDILKTQLILKKIITEDEWNEIRDEISFDFTEDNYFSEFKEIEILRERIETFSLMQQADMIGTYYSNEYIKREILKLSEGEIEKLRDEIDNEREEDPEGEYLPQNVDSNQEPPKVEEPEVETPKPENKDSEEENE